MITRACGELAVRLHQPALAGELIAGIVLGVAVARLSDAFPVLADLSEYQPFTAIAGSAIA